ncbi:hypothetical protein [Jannaschia seohaensis]|uniref:Cytochrome P460 n=1 Tax=Jannaschia seohaensis TaxID=475081 RepID=A0A2Y9C2K6_9RHOB|nr:hypothetical protein [Jannaschia seohaensis]PWJ15033.1 hypothetical protein BCF38_11150 [Jannaschia seohaensis]SSA49882.1 hypothetical protein SAMN05421539_11150 [Jannaschia seohaensis]
MPRPPLLALAACLALPAQAQTYADCEGPGWQEKSDAAFAADCVAMAFEGDLAHRQRLAWLFFARINQPIPAKAGTGIDGGDWVPQWLGWPTDPDTFATRLPFPFDNTPRATMKPSVEKKALEAGRITREDPDGSNEEVTRNRIAYDYLIEAGLTTKRDVDTFFKDKNMVDMPVGSVELKASWMRLEPDQQAPDGAITYTFTGGTYYFRGLHIMVKMQSLTNPEDIFYSEEPSWFWTTFEFNGDPGVDHIRETFITQRAPLDLETEIKPILAEAGIAGLGFESYAPNGTQIRFTVDGDGSEPVILGHSHMEDFAGGPNTAQPQYWTQFEASCHSCHATASYNPKTGLFFPFSVPKGVLSRTYNNVDTTQLAHYLSQGYRPLDFMWPIAFQAR